MINHWDFVSTVTRVPLPSGVQETVIAVDKSSGHWISLMRAEIQFDASVVTTSTYP